MRLICPNCDAEYQVDDAAVPASGRDVQCSNCGHAWFQLHADAEIAQEAEDALFGDAAVADAAIPAPQPAAPKADVDEGPAVVEAAMRPVAVRQSLAESVLSVLREEAERETAVRREEGPAETLGSVETQPDLGLEDVVQAGPVSAAARHIARLKGTGQDRAAVPDIAEERDLPGEPDLASDADFAFAPEPRVAARRDLLPDIEEINSTLRANADRAKDDDDEIDALPDLRPRRSGFRSGFILMMVLAVVLAMAYIMAPRIVAQIPGSAPALRAYVSAVDGGRLWLDEVMKSASGSLRSLTGDAK